MRNYYLAHLAHVHQLLDSLWNIILSSHGGRSSSLGVSLREPSLVFICDAPSCLLQLTAMLLPHVYELLSHTQNRILINTSTLTQDSYHSSPLYLYCLGFKADSLLSHSHTTLPETQAALQVASIPASVMQHRSHVNLVTQEFFFHQKHSVYGDFFYLMRAKIIRNCLLQTAPEWASLLKTLCLKGGSFVASLSLCISLLYPAHPQKKQIHTTLREQRISGTLTI